MTDILYAPHPPHLSITLTEAALARLDARLSDLDALRRAGTLSVVLQDSADLLGAHLIVRDDTNGEEWRASPLALDDDRDRDRPVALPGRWTREETARRLGLAGARATDMDASALRSVVGAWRSGLVLGFSRPGGAPGSVLTHRFDLADVVDRIELEFLGDEGYRPLTDLWAYRLGEGGHLDTWRGAVSTGVERVETLRWPSV
ncbi:hypothetical protein [Deinococcus pimensis]|uniref:hypothetical protein n=1 Tax=Deinococcus pimensis TaxID=309888 RepID=UPI000486C470|nr:hypothetical protein [Deinococcus pimensis]